MSDEGLQRKREEDERRAIIRELGTKAALTKKMAKERKRLIAELERKTAEVETKNAELEAMNAEVKFQNLELEKKNTELEARTAEMERFTYAVAHDLKSPLFTIQGFLGMLEKDAAKGNIERIETDIKKIRAAGARMRLLLDELLELSLIGRVATSPQEVSLVDLTHEAVDLVGGKISTRGVNVKISSDLPVIFGDRPRLLQVLQNLIENAVKFMGTQPEPRIEVATRQEGREVVCYVRDNGQGIDPCHREKIFDLFERLDLESQGTGMGLALVRRIVEVHGGRVWAESEGSGKGCCFCFVIPLTE